MSSVCCCLNFLWSKEPALAGPIFLHLDPRRRGPSCTASNYHIAGEGSALGNSSIMQDRGYWEVKVVTLGSFALGVANPQIKLTETKLSSYTAQTQTKSWGIESDTLLEHYELNASDIIGLAFDQSDEKRLRFFHNGEYLTGRDAIGIKGETWPLVAVAGGATLEVNFGSSAFAHTPPKMFDGVMASRSLV